MDALWVSSKNETDLRIEIIPPDSDTCSDHFQMGFETKQIGGDDTIHQISSEYLMITHPQKDTEATVVPIRLGEHYFPSRNHINVIK